MSLKMCMKMARDALSSRIYAVQEGLVQTSWPGLSLESIAAVAFLVERGVVENRDWQEVRDRLMLPCKDNSARAVAEKAKIAKTVLDRITPQLEKLNVVDRAILPRYIDDIALLVYEFAAWSWVRQMELDDTLVLIQNGRKPGKKAPYDLDPHGPRQSYKNRAPVEVLKESEASVLEHKTRIKWAKRKLRAAAKSSGASPGQAA